MEVPPVDFDLIVKELLRFALRVDIGIGMFGVHW